MLLFFSDIHGNKFSFFEFLKVVDKNPNAIVIFGGDVLGYYYHANEILDEMRKRKIQSVLGNHDQYFLDLLNGKLTEDELTNRYGSSYENILNKVSNVNVEYLKSMPTSLDFELNGFRFNVVHGSPTDHLNGRIYPDTDLDIFKKYWLEYDFVLLGHSHHKMVKKVGKTKIINAGSLGQQRDGKGCSYLEIDLITGSESIHVVNYDTTKLINLVKINDPNMKNNLEVLTRVK